MEYTTLDAGDLALVARDVLRGLETDHFRATVVGADRVGGQEYIDNLAARIEVVRAEVEMYEAAIPEPEAPETDEKGDLVPPIVVNQEPQDG